MSLTGQPDSGQVESLDVALRAKYSRLKGLLRAMGRVAVIYSGGAASTLLAKVAHDHLEHDMMAVFAAGESYGARAIDAAQALLDSLAIPYLVVSTREVNDPRYAANPVNRCYFCKAHINDLVYAAVEEYGFLTLANAFVAGDSDDIAPARKADRERGVRSPFEEADLTMPEVRQLARYLGLPNWSQPSVGCLASRVPHGMRITANVLRQIEQAEAALHDLGLSQLTVCHHDDLARIEVEPDAVPAVLGTRERIVQALSAVGYTYITLDLQNASNGGKGSDLVYCER